MTSLRVAVLIHTDDPVPLKLMQESYASIFQTLAPGSIIEFYNLLLSPELPDVSSTQYDLVVLGGGTYIPQPDAPWLRQLLRFEEQLLHEYTNQKVLAICLGHQTLATLRGATLEYLPEPELAIHKLSLTKDGMNFFDSGSLETSGTLRIHEFHRRYVPSLPQGFKELASDCQILISDDNRILTFQGHPEMTSELMSLLLTASSSEKSGYVNHKHETDGQCQEALLKRATGDHDGVVVFRSVVKWVAN